MDLYRDNILDHYRNPRNFGTLNNPDNNAEESNPLCGDKIAVQVKFKKGREEKMSIEEIRFSGEGCAIAMASASMLTEKVTGMQIDDVKKMKTKDILEMLGIELTPTRLKCALLSLEVVQKTLSTNTTNM